MGIIINFTKEKEKVDVVKPTIYDVANWFIKKGIENNNYMTPLKLQKLCFYSKVEALKTGQDLLKNDDFQAWVHGPANIELFRKYSGISMSSLIMCLNESEKIFDEKYNNILNKIYNKYKNMSGKDLEKKTHGEKPWKDARKDCLPYERSEEVITNNALLEYYSKIND